MESLALHPFVIHNRQYNSASTTAIVITQGRRLREKPWVVAVEKVAYSRFSSVKSVTKQCRGTRPGLYCRPYVFLSGNRRRRLSQARRVQHRGHAQSQRPGRNQPKLPVRVINSHNAHCYVRTNVHTKYWFPRNAIIRKCYVFFFNLLILISIDYASIQQYTSLKHAII